MLVARSISPPASAVLCSRSVSSTAISIAAIFNVMPHLRPRV
jgi:hypothetical protein